MCAWFSLLDDWADLTDEECGLLFRACLAYAATGAEPAFTDRTLRSLFRIQKKLIDSSAEHYAEVREKRKAAADARWNAKASVPMQMHAYAGNKEKRIKNKEYIPPKGGVGDQYKNEILEKLEVDLTKGNGK
jgi:hypothetical protein